MMADQWIATIHKQGGRLYSAKNDLAVIAAASERMGFTLLADDLRRLSEEIDDARREIRKAIRENHIIDMVHWATSEDKEKE